MIDLTTATLMLSISLIFLIFGLLIGRYAYLLTLFGGVMLIVSGVIFLGSPIEYKTGSTINTADSLNNIVTNTYSPINTNFNYFLSIFCILFGLVGFFGALFLIQTYNNHKLMMYEQSFE